MITGKNTELNVIELMALGAKLWFEYNCHPDFGTSLVKVELEHNSRRFTLSHWEKIPGVRWDSEEPDKRLINPLPDGFIKRPDIKRGYCYNSDYGTRYREVYEWHMMPVPWWLEQQIDPTDESYLRSAI